MRNDKHVLFVPGYRSLCDIHRAFMLRVQEHGSHIRGYDMLGHGINSRGVRGRFYPARSVLEVCHILQEGNFTVLVGHSCGALIILAAAALLRLRSPKKYRMLQSLHLVNPAFNTGHNVPWYVHYAGVFVGTLMPRLSVNSFEPCAITKSCVIRESLESAEGLYRGPLDAGTALSIYLSGKCSLLMLPFLNVPMHMHFGDDDTVVQEPWDRYVRLCQQVIVHRHQGNHDLLDLPSSSQDIVACIATDLHDCVGYGSEAWVTFS